MQLESKTYLFDIQQAARRIVEFAGGRTYAEYEADPMLRSAIERQCEIIGEALRRLSKVDATACSQISDSARIIAFRNILAHGYADVDDRIVWDIVESKVPVLLREVDALLK